MLTPLPLETLFGKQTFLEVGTGRDFLVAIKKSLNSENVDFAKERCFVPPS